MGEQIARVRPVLSLLAVLVISAFLGYLWGAASTEIVDTGLWQLHPTYQVLYVQTVADAYALDHNDALAIERLSYLCQANNNLITVLNEAARIYGSDPAKSAHLDELRTLVIGGQVVQSSEVAVCNTQPIDNWARYGRLLAPILTVLMGIGIVIYGILVVIRAGEQAAVPARPVTAAPPTPAAVPAAGPGVAAAPPPSAEETVPAPATRPRAVLPSLPGLGRRREEPTEPRSVAAMGARLSQAAEKTDFVAQGQEPPIVQFMTTYLHGDDLYDDSFSIETPGGEFLGETGVGISETIGAPGEPKKVTALEVWLFDKNDIRTVTKVLMSDHAFNDDAIRAKLAPKGEAVLARGGDRLILETATLRVQARIVDLAYKPDAMPPNGVIERITLELAAWKREGLPSRPGGAGGLPGSPGGTPPTGLPPFSGGN